MMKKYIRKFVNFFYPQTQTYAPNNFRGCSWGSELRVKEQGPQSAQAEIHMIYFIENSIIEKSIILEWNGMGKFKKC
jgi:hypothetical protein